MLPHLGAAFTLARYLLREQADAEDAVQEAYLQALRYFAGFRGENPRAWLLTIVRRVCYGWIERTRRQPWADPEMLDDLPEPAPEPPPTAPAPRPRSRRRTPAAASPEATPPEAQPEAPPPAEGGRARRRRRST